MLFSNSLLGHLPDDLGNCHTLSRVRIWRNYLSGTIPHGFLYLPNLSIPEMDDNLLTGQLEETNSLVSTKLQQLRLLNNQLSGPLPTSIKKFSSLQILRLNGNQFTSNIPFEIGYSWSAWKQKFSCYHLQFCINFLCNCHPILFLMKVRENRSSATLEGLWFLFDFKSCIYPSKLGHLNEASIYSMLSIKTGITLNIW